MLVAGVILHCSCCLGATIAGVLVECVDTLNMCAVATEKDDTVRFFADFVHTLSLLSVRLRTCPSTALMVATRHSLVGSVQTPTALAPSSAAKLRHRLIAGTTLSLCSQKAVDGLFQLGVHLIGNNHDVRQHRSKIHGIQVALDGLEDTYL